MLLDTYLDIARLVEPIHLVQQLEQDTLHLTVSTRLRVEPLRGDGVNLVDEDNGGRVLPSQPEDVADHAWTFAEVFLDELRAVDADEGSSGVVRDSLDEHGLASSCK